MAEGWKQVWEDMRQAIFGKALDTVESGRPTAVDEQPDQAAALIDDSETDATPILETESPTLEPPATSPAGEPDTLTKLQIAAPVVGARTDQETTDIETTSLPWTIPADDQLAAEPDAAADTLSRSPARQLPKRWLVVIFVVAIVVVAWFFYRNELSASWVAPKAPAPDVVATFDDGQITIVDLEAHMAQLVGSEFADEAHVPVPEEIMLVVQDLVMDELVSQWAAERQPESEETFKHTMQHINEELNLQSLEGQLHEGDIPVTESEIQAYYNENRDLFGDQTLTTVREQIRQTLVAEKEQDYVAGYVEQLKENASVALFSELLDVPAPAEDELRRYYEDNRNQFTLPRQVVVDELLFPIGEDETAARKAADDALLKLRSGADFIDIPDEIPSAVVTSDETRVEGMRGDEWDTVVFAMTNEELSDIFRAGDAFYIVRLQDKQNARPQTFEEVSSFLETVVASQVMDDWFADNDNKTLFTIKSTRYTVGEFYQEYQELPFTVQAQFSGPEGMKDLAERLIERLLLVADANERLLDVENQDLANEARLQILKQMLHQEEVDDKIEIMDEDIQQFYEENQALMAFPPQARIRYIRIGLGNSGDEEEAARQRAEEAYEKLVPGLFQQGEDFAAVVQEYSEDPESAANGGELPGWVGESDDLLDEFEMHSFHEAILSLPVDEISRPFEFDGSLYIAQVLERSAPEAVGLEEARPFIEEILTQQKHEELELQLQEQLLEQSNFEIYWPVLETYLQQLPTPEPFPFPLPTPSA